MPPRPKKSPRTLNLDLTQQLVDYGCYHSKPLNQLVHFFFVPPLMLTLAVLMEVRLPSLSGVVPSPSLLPFLPGDLSRLARFNWPLVVLSLYSAYYTSLDAFAGATWTALCALPMWLSATAWAEGSLLSSTPLASLSPAGSAALVHVASWAVQVGIGHAVVEGRRPALVDSFFQSVVLAGLFAWFELLFSLGYRPKLKREVDRRVGADAERRGLVVGGGGGAGRVTRSRSGRRA